MKLTLADPEILDKTKCFLNILLGIFWFKKICYFGKEITFENLNK